MVVTMKIKPAACFYTAVLALFLLTLTYNYQSLPDPYTLLTAMTTALSSSQWSSEYSGWHSRSTPYDSPDKFTPTQESLAFAVLRSTQGTPDGYTLAFFTPNIAVDAMGRVLVVPADHFAGITLLAKQTLELPSTNSFRNSWRIDQQRTEQPIERLLVPTKEGQNFKQTGVQGFEKGKKMLKEKVGDLTELPDVLYELFGLVAEAREGYVRGGEDTETISEVKAVLRGV